MSAALIAALNLAAGILQVGLPIFQKMQAEGRKEMTPEERATLRAATDAARQYAIDSEPGMPIVP